MRWHRLVLRLSGVALLVACLAPRASAQHTFVPMDESQRNHLKAYGLAYWALQAPRQFNVEWLLNYRGGAFLILGDDAVGPQANRMGVSFQVVSDAERQHMHQEMEAGNMDVVLLEKAPRVAVYAPPTVDPWDDAVRLALDYAEIPYERIWDPEVLGGRLHDFDWLHLHHEDFTGQFGKFYASFHNAPWYIEQVSTYKKAAAEAGFPSVQAHKHAVVLAIADYVQNGGFVFAMCSATDTFDIALAAGDVDIVPAEIDGTPMTPGFQSLLDFNKTLAFTHFTVEHDANRYEHSDIDVSVRDTTRTYQADRFVLFDFSAKVDPIPTMLVQDHTNSVKDFLGQCTGFDEAKIKPSVTLLAEFPGKGTFTFLGGHDPEDYAHIVNEEPTDLALHKNSPGYRLILNNILFPAARKKERKT